MLALLADYGLFLAKTLTLVIAILAVVIVVAAIIAKNKQQGDSLNIKHLNDKFTDIKNAMREAMLSKDALKKAEKAEKAAKKSEKAQDKPRIFVMNFEGDIKASAVNSLRECVSAILTQATPKDEVVAIIESPGGLVHGYGLAASQLARIKAKSIPLTTVVDKVAASGGYMMACVGNKVLSAPFAVIGSIGVVAQVPNFHRLLDKHNIDVELHTAGEYKRTITMFGKNTEKGREKFQEELEETHHLFKQFVAEHRPALDLQKVANGEHWYGLDALKYNLVDDIQTSDDYLMSKLDSHDIFEIDYSSKKPLSERVSGFVNRLRVEFFGLSH